MNKNRKIYFFLAGCSFLFALIFKFISVGMGFTASCFVVLTLLFVLFALLGDSKGATLTKRIITVVLAVILIFAVVTEILVFAHAHTNADNDTDWLIILGAGLHGKRLSYSIKSRLDRALEFLDGNKDCFIVVSGGMGKGESVTEASAMKEYLANNGISENRIYLEDKATTTEENLRFSFEIISSSSEYKRGDSIAILSSAYHLYRTSLMVNSLFGTEYGKITYIAARTKRFIAVNYYLREIAAIWYYIILK